MPEVGGARDGEEKSWALKLHRPRQTSRRMFLRVALLLLAFGTSLRAAAPVDGAMEKPNIIFNGEHFVPHGLGWVRLAGGTCDVSVRTVKTGAGAVMCLRQLALVPWVEASAKGRAPEPVAQ